MLPTVATVLLSRSPSNPYLDEIAASDTILLPAFNQQTGGIELTTLGNMMTLAEIDTMLLPAMQVHHSNISKHLNTISQDNSQSEDEENTAKRSAIKMKSVLSRKLKLEPLNTPMSLIVQPYQRIKEVLADFSTVHMRKSDIEKELAKQLAELNKEATANISTLHMQQSDLEKEMNKQLSGSNKEVVADFSTVHMRKSDVEEEHEEAF